MASTCWQAYFMLQVLRVTCARARLRTELKGTQKKKKIGAKDMFRHILLQSMSVGLKPSLWKASATPAETCITAAGKTQKTVST